MFLAAVLSFLRPHLRGTELGALALLYGASIGAIMAFANTLIFAQVESTMWGVVQSCGSPYSLGSLAGLPYLALSIAPRVDTWSLVTIPVDFPFLISPIFFGVSVRPEWDRC
jgi:hypothetical protein